MSMTSFRFILFFVFVYILLWIIRGMGRLRRRSVSFLSQCVLLLASYLFLAFSDWRFCFCLLLFTIFIFLLSIKINASKKAGESGGFWLSIGIFLSVFMLGICKYFNFFSESLGKWLGVDYITLNLILPVGISFYTFSAINYIVDVYHGKYEACFCFWQFALYMGFFPKLVAGPIIRADEFLPQLKEERGVSIKNLEAGIQQMYTWSFFAMIVLGIATCVAVVKSKKENCSQIEGFYPILNLSHFWSLVLFFVFCGLTIGMGYYGNNVFIYGRF